MINKNYDFYTLADRQSFSERNFQRFYILMINKNYDFYTLADRQSFSERNFQRFYIFEKEK